MFIYFRNLHVRFENDTPYLNAENIQKTVQYNQISEMWNTESTVLCQLTTKLPWGVNSKKCKDVQLVTTVSK